MTNAAGCLFFPELPLWQLGVPFSLGFERLLGALKAKISSYWVRDI